jgi:hypothetical protein
MLAHLPMAKPDQGDHKLSKKLCGQVGAVLLSIPSLIKLSVPSLKEIGKMHGDLGFSSRSSRAIQIWLAS